MNWRLRAYLPALRKLAVAIAGFGVLAAGVALIVLPGPAVVVIPIGLAILAREFPWASRLLTWLRRLVRRAWTTAQTIGRYTLTAQRAG
jgi:tellurite resistance protein TerC